MKDRPLEADVSQKNTFKKIMKAGMKDALDQIDPRNIVRKPKMMLMGLGKIVAWEFLGHFIGATQLFAGPFTFNSPMYMIEEGGGMWSYDPEGWSMDWEITDGSLKDMQRIYAQSFDITPMLMTEIVDHFIEWIIRKNSDLQEKNKPNMNNVEMVYDITGFDEKAFIEHTEKNLQGDKEINEEEEVLKEAFRKSCAKGECIMDQVYYDEHGRLCIDHETAEFIMNKLGVKFGVHMVEL